jgi:predicted glutamine amidotransferase
MCQLLGMNSSAAASIRFSFTGFAQRGGCTADHVDGWGIAFYEATGARSFLDDGPASASGLAAFVREYPIRSHNVISHIRKATQGAVGLSNTHPFSREWLGRHWFFAHNGDLQNFHPPLDGSYLPAGSTDSEKAFCYLMQCLRQAFAGWQRAPGWEAMAPVLAACNEAIARHGNFNYLLTNGEALFVHCSSQLAVLQRAYPFSHARLVDCDLSMDLGALNGPDDRMVIVATEPLTVDEQWQALQTGDTRVYVGGRAVWTHQCPRTRRFAVPGEALAEPVALV